MADPQIIFSSTFPLSMYDGVPIQVPDLPALHNVVDVWIFSATDHLHTSLNVDRWLRVGGADELTQNGGAAALVEGNAGVIAIGGAAAAIFSGTPIDVVVQVLIAAPTGRIGRFA